MAKRSKLFSGAALTRYSNTDAYAAVHKSKSLEEQLEYVEEAEAKGDPFTIQYHEEVPSGPKSKKRKRVLGGPFVQEGHFEESLDCRYDIQPRDIWLSMRKFQRFTLTHQVGEGTTTVNVGDHVLVLNDPTLIDEKASESQLWKATVLEVRAVDAEHAYVRVAWLNRPEDLESGREAHHGSNELIPSNHMDIIAAMAVNGRIRLSRIPDLNDEVDGKELSDNDAGLSNYYWRQTFDFTNQKLSPVQRICIDRRPHNPEEETVQCGSCREWMHVRCIAIRALQTTRRASGLKASRDKDIKNLDKTRPGPDVTLSDGDFEVRTRFADENIGVKDEITFIDAKKAYSEIEVSHIGRAPEVSRIYCLLCEKPVD